jgi:hypothetical protein
MANSAVESIVRWYFYYTWNCAFYLGPYVTRGIIHVEPETTRGSLAYTWQGHVEGTRGTYTWK